MTTTATTTATTTLMTLFNHVSHSSWQYLSLGCKMVQQFPVGEQDKYT